MKLKKLIICGAGLAALASCNDYLNVDAPSKYFPEDIYASVKDVNTALNGVYADILASNTFGNAYTYSLIYNTDVDFNSNSNSGTQTNTPKRYDVTSASGTANSVWNATYQGIENANNFIHYLENSEIYTPSNDDYVTLVQYMGEAKVMRAMLYYELMCYWGDVPFTLEPTSSTKNFTPPITSRDTIAAELINDLAQIAPSMKYANALSDGVERASKEACWAMISRIALQAAGYSLRPGADDSEYGVMETPEDGTGFAQKQWFLEKSRAYADSVIESKTHSLTNSYQDVFLNECNMKVINNDDPIFELPFTIESSGYIGYNQGPKFEENGGSTDYQWGKCGGSQQVSAFYRYSFKPGDTRKDVQNGWWYYTYDGIPKIMNGYSFYNNKWSKLYNTTSAFSKTSDTNTGINYPYLRYADVLLMYAEADYKLTGTASEKAINCVKQVRNRAFEGSDVPEVETTDFLKTILNERKWEFAGENMRWKDLVRNNLLAEVVYHTFFTYWVTANSEGGVADPTNEDNVMAYDGVRYFGSEETYTQEEIDAALPGEDAFGKTAGKAKGEILPSKVYYCYIKNPADNSYFANNSLNCLYIYNKESNLTKTPSGDQKTAQKLFKYIAKNFPDSKQAGYTPIEEPNNAQSTALTGDLPYAEFYNWYESDGYPKAQALYSFYGFIHGGETAKDKVFWVRNGIEEEIPSLPFEANPANLPVIRYLLPIPKEAITRAAGAYKNHYGYSE